MNSMEGSKVNSGITPHDAKQDLSAIESVRHFGPAPVMDVMVEQLEYLFTHSRGTCASNCVECSRMVQVQRYLLQPFRSSVSAIANHAPMA